MCKKCRDFLSVDTSKNKKSAKCAQDVIGKTIVSIFSCSDHSKSGVDVDCVHIETEDSVLDITSCGCCDIKVSDDRNKQCDLRIAINKIFHFLGKKQDNMEQDKQ